MSEYMNNRCEVTVTLSDDQNDENRDRGVNNNLQLKFGLMQEENLVRSELEFDGSQIRRDVRTRELRDRELLFSVESIPPWYITFLYAFQQVLSTISGPVGAAFLIHSNVCGEDDQVFLSELIGTSVFMSGLCTFLQVTFGVRLPIIQGSSMVYLPVIISLMSTTKWKCPLRVAGQLQDDNDTGLSPMSVDLRGLNLTQAEESPWKSRMNELSGALAVAASVQVILGCTGAVGLLMKFIGPLTIAPAVAMIGLSLQDVIADYASQQWGVSMSTACVFILVSQLLKNVQVPFPVFNRQRGLHAVRYPIFRLFPPIFAISFGWMLCYILTTTGHLSDQPEDIGYRARTDIKTQFIHNNKWFFVPYPGMWGMPSFSAGVFLGMLSATICSIVESVGDYYAAARACGVVAPPKHAMNRGIAMEGLGSIICGLVGAGHATTSYSESIGIIPVTGMGSRITWQVAGLFMMSAGVLGKFGAVLSTIPDPVIGGILIISLGMVISVGLSNIQFIDLRTGRNMLILGTSFLLGLMIPRWIHIHAHSIETGYEQIDQMLTILLGTPMFIGGLTGCLLDNVLPGTLEERGIIEFRKSADYHHQPTDEEACQEKNGENNISSSIYDLPFSKRCHQYICCTYLPFLPCYKEQSLNIKNYFRCCRNTRKNFMPASQDERETV